MGQKEAEDIESDVDRAIEAEPIISKSITETDQRYFEDTTFTEGTVSGLYQISNSKYTNWDPNEEHIIAVELTVDGRTYIAEYNLSKDYYQREFQKLLAKYHILEDEPTDLIGQRVTLLAGSSKYKIFLGDTDKPINRLIESDYMVSKDIAVGVKPRYVLMIAAMSLSVYLISVPVGLILTVILTLPLLFLLLGIEHANASRDAYHEDANPNLVEE